MHILMLIANGVKIALNKFSDRNTNEGPDKI